MTMETLSENFVAKPRHAEIIRGVTLTPPVIGRIAAGHTIVKGDKAYPVKDDHYTLTTLVQDGKTRVWEEHPLQKTLLGGQEKLRAIPVRIAYDDVNLNLHNRFSAFDPQKGRPLCVGNGDSARRLSADGVKDIDCPRPGSCEFGQRLRCRNFSRAYFRIEGQEDELGAFILRTTSFNSLDRLGSRLNQLAGFTGGKLANLPMQLVLMAKTSVQSFRTPVYFSDLVTRPGMSLMDAVGEARRYHEVMADAGLSLAGLEEALRAGLANGDFADEVDPEEWLSDEELVAEAERPRSPSGLRGMDSLSRHLGEIAARKSDEKTSPDRIEHGARHGPRRESPDGHSSE
jgi:hypothetical protein